MLIYFGIAAGGTSVSHLINLKIYRKTQDTRHKIR
jgi:hypothetical protein